MGTTEPTCAVDPTQAEQILENYPAVEASLIQVLQDVHRAYNYLPCDVLTQVAKSLDVPLAKLFSVATFYKAFSLDPQGDTIIKICTGTACHIRGAVALSDEVERLLAISPDETTDDMKYTLKTVNCVGACAMAPVMIVGEKYRGNARSARIPGYLTDREKDLKGAGDAD
jgi:NADH:ubiquinone oxidoreductase subunit E